MSPKKEKTPPVIAPDLWGYRKLPHVLTSGCPLPSYICRHLSLIRSNLALLLLFYQVHQAFISKIVLYSSPHEDLECQYRTNTKVHSCPVAVS